MSNLLCLSHVLIVNTVNYFNYFFCLSITKMLLYVFTLFSICMYAWGAKEQIFFFTYLL